MEGDLRQSNCFKTTKVKVSGRDSFTVEIKRNSATVLWIPAQEAANQFRSLVTKIIM